MKNTYTYAYPRPNVTVDAVIFAYDQTVPKVLLIQRGNEPFAGMWALPGGFVDENEPLDKAVARELMEETGLTGIPLRQYFTFGDPGRDPRGWTVTIAFVGELAEICPVAGGDDAADAAWWPVHALPPMAFDHDWVIEKGWTACAFAQRRISAS